jgi:hypothetical protein
MSSLADQDFMNFCDSLPDTTKLPKPMSGFYLLEDNKLKKLTLILQHYPRLFK